MELLTKIVCFFIVIGWSGAATIKGPPTAEKSDLVRIVRLGEDVRLICPISAYPVPMYEWMKDGETINPYTWTRFKVQKKALKIRAVSTEDTGVYVCKGTNGFGSEEIRMDLITIDPSEYPLLKEGEVPDIAAPVWTLSTQDQRKMFRKQAGDSVRLACEALGKPQPAISWFKDRQPYNVDVSESDGRSVLTLDRLTGSKSGVYTCVAKNAAGQQMINFTLDVEDSTHDQPELSNGPENTTVEQGAAAFFECRVRSSTAPNIKWFKKLDSWELGVDPTDVIEVGAEKFRVLQQNSEDVPTHEPNDYLSKLVIPEARETDSGMYYCFVTNPRGYKFKNAYLTVTPKSVTTELEREPILILVICLAVFVLALLIGISVCVVCVNRKRQKPQPPVPESPDVRDALMGGNNNRNAVNIHVNKMNEPLPAVPASSSGWIAPPPSTAKSSTSSQWGGGPYHLSSDTYDNGTQPPRDFYYHQSQNQYEVPHVTTGRVAPPRSYAGHPASVYDARQQPQTYAYRSQQQLF